MRRDGRIWVLGVLAAALLAATTAGGARGAVFTVGPGGTHSTIQGALDASVWNGGGFDEVRVAQGSWRERLQINDGPFGGRLWLSGGWDPDFRIRSRDERTTVVDGEGGNAVIGLLRTTGEVRITGLTVTGTDHVHDGTGGEGGAVVLALGGDVEVRLEDLAIEDNRVVGTGDASVRGVGLTAFLNDAAELVVTESRFADNLGELVPGSTDALHGGGLYVVAWDDSRVEIRDCDFLRNRLATPDGTSVSGAAMSLRASQRSAIQALDNHLEDNRVEAPAANPSEALAAVAGDSNSPASDSTIVLARNMLLDNFTSSAYSGAQLSLLALPGSRITVTDSLLARGNGHGLTASTWEGGRVDLTNLTVTGHPEIGIVVSVPDGAAASVANSIVWSNGTNLELFGEVELSHNHLLSNPRFVHPTGDDYRLRFGSPAIDAGDDLPPGGLGPADLDLAARRQGAHVDIGAYETAFDRGSDFPACRVLGAPDPPIDPDSNACTCFRDPGLRVHLCEFLLPGLLAGARIPFDFAAGKAVRVDWTLLPRSEVAGSYALRAAAEIDGQWIAQEWLGPKADKLVRDRSVVEPFRVKPAFDGPTPLRTELRWKTSAGWRSETFELLLPAAMEGAP